MQFIAARFCDVALCQFFLLIVCHVRHLLVRRLHRLLMGYRPKFCCQDWRSHPQGLVLMAELLVVPSKKPGEKAYEIQCRAAKSLVTVSPKVRGGGRVATAHRAANQKKTQGGKPWEGALALPGS